LEVQPNGAPWPKISIVTPSYNQGAFIEETIRSILLQGYPNLEFIVIDGGSTDDSVDIIEKYDPWITHWVSEEDKGQSDAINKGFRRANGEIYNWLNSDDLLLPNALQHIARIFSLDRSTDWLACGRVNRNSVGGTLGGSVIWRSEWVKYVFDLPDFPQDATFFDSSIWEQVGGLEEDLEYNMDVLFFHKMLKASKNGVLSNLLVSIMNIHEDQKTIEEDSQVKQDERSRINDVYDMDTDAENPKKDDREVRYRGDRLVPALVVATGALGVAFLPLLPADGAAAMVAFLLLAAEYSAPPLRFKTTPLLDSVSNGLYVLPGVVAYAAVAGSVPPLAAIAGGWLWAMAMHTFSAIPDIDPDRRAGIRTTATVLGEQRTYAYCGACWLAAAAVFGLVHPFFAAVLAGYPLFAAGIVAADVDVDRAYWWFPAINTVAGMTLTLAALWVMLYG